MNIEVTLALDRTNTNEKVTETYPYLYSKFAAFKVIR